MTKTKTASINVRLYPKLKQEAENGFAYHGLSLPEAITVFLKRVIRRTYEWLQTSICVILLQNLLQKFSYFPGRKIFAQVLVAEPHFKMQMSAVFVG